MLSAQPIMGLIFLAIPAFAFYLVVKKDIRMSIVFGLLLAGVSALISILIRLLGMEALVNITGAFSLFLVLFAIFYAVIFITLNLMKEKRDFKVIFTIAILMIIGTAVIILFGLQSGLDNISLNSVII